MNTFRKLLWSSIFLIMILQNDRKIFFVVIGYWYSRYRESIAKTDRLRQSPRIYYVPTVLFLRVATQYQVRYATTPRW